MNIPENTSTNYPESYSKFLDAVHAWEASGNGVKPFVAAALVSFLIDRGFNVIDTHGMPFNGTTYEVRRAVEGMPYTFEMCGHYKHVTAIYGNGCTLFFYPPSCKGGSHLNNGELKLYTEVFNTYSSR